MPVQGTLEKIEKPASVDDTAYSQIKQAILDCVLTPGAPLVETRLAEDLGVSRTPVRRAIARLEQEGFASADVSKGYKVSEISARDLEEIYELREILECHLIRETTPQFTEKDLAEIEGALQTADEAMEQDDYPGFLDANRGFHHVFDRKYGNLHISRVLDRLDEHVYRAIMWGFLVRGGAGKSQFGYRDHSLILKAIRDGDVESAVSIMRSHLRYGPHFPAEPSVE